MKQEFIVGNWYQHFQFQKTKAKFLKVQGDRWIGSEWICEGGNYENEKFISHKHENTKPISIEEIKQFLPEGHPDLQNTEPNYEIY